MSVCLSACLSFSVSLSIPLSIFVYLSVSITLQMIEVDCKSKLALECSSITTIYNSSFQSHERIELTGDNCEMQKGPNDIDV
jgi:hypothetical protein